MFNLQNSSLQTGIKLLLKPLNFCLTLIVFKIKGSYTIDISYLII